MVTFTPVDGDPFAVPAPVPGTRAVGKFKLIPVEGDPFAESSATGSFARSAGRATLPAVGGAAGFGAGFAAGGLLTAPAEAVPIAGTAINLLGAFGGGLLGAFGAGSAVDAAQDKVLSLLPAVRHALGQDDDQRAADASQHPYATFAGSLAPNLLTMRPGFRSLPVAADASLLTRALAHPASGAAVGATLGGGLEAAREMASDEGLDPTKLGMATAFGAAGNRPTRLGSELFSAGGKAVVKGAYTAAKGAGMVYRGAADAVEASTAAVRGFRDRSGTVEGEFTRQPAKLIPVEGDPFAEPAPVAGTRTVGKVKLVPVEGDPFKALPAPTELPPEAAPAPTVAVAPQPADGAKAPTLPPPDELGVPRSSPAAEPVLHATDLRPDPGELADGEHFVTTPAGNKIRSRYEVVDTTALTPAEGELQNRDRSRASTDLQVQDIVAGFDPARLGASAETDRGAPIVGPDSVVESGNGRMLALNRIYDDPAHADKADAYRAMIEAQGHSTEGVARPVLIRRRVSDFSPEQRRQFVVDSNTDAKLALTSVERAKSDADNLNGDTLALYQGGDVTHARNAEFVKRFNAGVPKAELGAMVDGQTNLSQEGTTRIENALMARAYEEPAVLSKLMEARDNNIRSIGAGMLDNAGGWAKLRADVKDGTVKPEFDVTKQLVEAARKVSDIRSAGGKIGDHLNQSDAFSERDPIVDGFIRTFYNPELSRAASREAITDAIQTYVRRAREQTTEARMFGGDDTTPDAILRSILDDRNTAKHGGLFAVAAEDKLPKGAPGSRAALAAALNWRAESIPDLSDAGSIRDRHRFSDDDRSAFADDGEDDNDQPDYSAGRTLDKGAYDPGFMQASYTNRTSIYSTAAVALGIDPDKFALMAAPKQVAKLQEAMKSMFGVDVTVAHDLQERFAIDQMLDAFQTVQGMAHVLDLPAKAISLGGALKLQLQKKGNFLGSFQPGANLITLPKRSNSFAHEWGHALDWHLLGLLTDGEGHGLSGAIRKRGSAAPDAAGAPANVREAFVALLNSMFLDKAASAAKIMDFEAKIAATKSPKVAADLQGKIDRIINGNSQLNDIRSAFYKGAKSFNGGAGSDYWTSPTEMFARAFEAYVSYKAEAAGLTTEVIGKGDAAYLSNADERFAKTFPKGEERAEIFAAFENVFGNLADQQALAIGPGAAKSESGPVRRITDYDKTPVVARERGIIRREITAIRNAALAAKKAAADRPDSPKGVGELIADLNGATFMSMTGNLRMVQARSKSPALQKLIDLLSKQDGRGDRTVERTFAEDVHIQSKRGINRLTNIMKANHLEHLDAEDTMVLRDLLTGSREAAPAGMDHLVKGAAAIRHLLDEEFYTNQRAGIDLGYTRSGYLARVLDLPKVYGDQPGFVTQATKVYGMVFDKEYGTDSNDVLEDDEKRPAVMKMARQMAKGGADMPSLPGVRALLKQIKKLAAEAAKAEDPGPILSKIDGLQDQLADEFGALFGEVREAFAEARAEAWLAKINLVAGEEQNAGSPDSKYIKHRTLPPETDKIMEKYFLSDPIESVTNYLNQSARRTSYALRFGPKGEKRKALFEAMAKQGVAPADQHIAAHILDIATGRVRSSIPVAMQKALSFINAAGTMALLPRATISSLAEPFTAALVTGDARDGFKMMSMTIAGALGSPNGKVRFELARAMGIVSDAANDHIMEARYGQSYADETRFDRFTSTMFRRTGLTGLTRAQKAAGVGLGHAFLDNLAQQIASGDSKEAENATALMRELGIRDPEAFSKELLDAGRMPSVEDLNTPYGEDYTTAQLRFSKMVVQEPDAMDRPAMSANPVGRVLYGITGFSYGYWRNIMKRNGILIGEMAKDSARGGNAKAALYSSALFAGAAIAFLVGTTISTIREAILNPKRFAELDANGTLNAQMAQLGFTRTFSFGAADTAIQALSGLKYQRDFSNTMVGPGISFMLGNAEKMARPVYANSRKTNSAEYSALQGAYSAASPFLSFGLARIPGGDMVGAATGAGMAYVTSPAARDLFASSIVGAKNGSPGPAGKKVKSGPTALDHALDGVFGPVTRKKTAHAQTR